MKLEQQVTSLEISKRLKELGVKQESLFYWQQGYQEMKGDVSASAWEITQKKKESKKGLRCYSAFTVAELGEMLPEMCIEGEKRVAEKWNIDSFTADTEADARGKMLIYLLENNLIEVTK